MVKKYEFWLLPNRFDACFGLHRRKTHGMLDLPPRHGNLVIEDQIVIDKFIEEYPKTQRTKNAEENVSIKNMFHFKLNSAKLCTTCKLVLVCFLPGRGNFSFL